MHIEELKEADSGRSRSIPEGEVVAGAAGGRKRAFVGVGARLLFYPTLLYNVVRNRFESEFRWWDRVDEFLLLGAVPFPTDVPRLKQLGVGGVVTLNEPYETLVPTSLYLDYGIENLVIPTRDYLFAPSFENICQAVDFIHKNASHGETTYVHCKAGRGRSTTVVLCYLVHHKKMTPSAAYEYVRLIRPRVLLAASQWQAVQDYYFIRVKKTGRSSFLEDTATKIPSLMVTRNFVAFDESSFVMISETDLDGYDGQEKSRTGNAIWAELSIVYRMQFTGQAALVRLSGFWLRHRVAEDVVVHQKLGREACSMEADQVKSAHPCLLRGMAINSQ